MLTKLALALVGAVPALAMAQPDDRYWPGPWHMWGGWGFGWLFPFLMVGFVFLCLFLLMRAPRHGHGPGDTTSSALRLLNERFAKGEISKDELEEKRRAISS